MVSLPALGAVRLYPRARDAIVRLIGELFRHSQDGLDPDDRSTPARRLRRPPNRPEPTEGAGTRFVATGRRSVLRLLAGMVRANRPWQLFTGLSRALAGVFATAAFALINNAVWQMGDSLDPPRHLLIALGSIAALVGWLIIDHELWERPSTEQARDRARLYNTATAVTLTLGVLALYAVLFGLLLVSVPIVLTPEVFQENVQHHVHWNDYLGVVWFATSASMVGGALGSGLEDDLVVRQAAYGERQRRRRAEDGDAPTG